MLDAAWGDFPTIDVGYDWARYTGNARPDAAWVATVLTHSRVTFIQESYSTRSSEGYDVGVADCRYAEQRAREVHPGVESIAVVVSDGNGADNWDASPYGQGWADAATIPFFPYGAQPICESFLRGAAQSRLCLGGTWVPETWGQGTFMSQLVTASPLANTDLNTVHAAYYPVAPTPPVQSEEDDDMPYIAQLTALDGRKEMRLVDGGRILIDFGLAEEGAPYGVPKSWVEWKSKAAWRDTLKRLDFETAEWDALAK